jgi:3-oxoadipate enol-lactonase
MTAVHHMVDGPASAPAVLLSNSLGTTLEMWDAQLPALTERYRVVRYDTRGHGRSPVPPGPYRLDDLVDDVLDLLDRLGIARVHFAGLSLGGMTGLRLAAREPDRVERLTVLCTSAHLPPASSWTGRAALVRAHGTAAIADAVLDRWFTPAYQDRAAARLMLESIPAEGYAGCCEAIAAMNLTADLPGITAPVLAIAGAGDPATPPDHLARIVAAVPYGRLLVIDGAAHLASMEQPAAVTDAILEPTWTR